MSRADTRPHAPQRKGVAAIAWGLAVVYFAVLGLTFWMDARVFALHAPGSGSTWVTWHGPWMGPFAVFAVVGAVIVSRRPRNTIGWVMLSSALAALLGEAVRTYAMLVVGSSPDPSGMFALGAVSSGMTVTVFGLFLGVVVVPLLFPDGRLPSSRWRVILWSFVPLMVILHVGEMFSPRITDGIVVPGEGERAVYEIANPLANEGLHNVAASLPPSGLLLVMFVVAAAGAVIMRFRRSRGVERQQMKWFVYAAALVPFAVGVITVLEVIAPGFGTVELLLLVVVLSAYPVAVAVAVLRYRLYEIDRIISRTVSYGLIVAVLGGVYIAGVVGLGAAVTAVTGQGDSDLVVAASTLAAAGLFRPVRARIQTAVDRRFNRTGYDARRAVDAFTHEVRDEVDLDQIREQLAETAAVATQPTHVSVWIPDRED